MKLNFLIFIILLAALNSSAQVDSVYTGRATPDTLAQKKLKQRNEEWKKSVTWGGNFQAWLGNPTFIFVSPTVGFIPYKNFNLGVGLIYNYTRMSGYYGSFSQSIFGGHSYLRYIIADSYFLQAQVDKLHQPNLLSLDPTDKTWVDYYLVGGGFRQSIGEKAALITSIMYNLNPDPLSIYPSRIIIQFGITGRF